MRSILSSRSLMMRLNSIVFSTYEFEACRLLDDGMKCSLSEFVEDIKMGKAVSMLDSRAAIHRDLDSLEK
ncbi:hypothetical protein QYF61_005828 [Mycteria americana]|uniref:Uncharacterized protein n=1 Tax=Mycteria americana TaxID=33587 RepID=A0AAN7MPE2_MYCAM|nr:hypothetical protein QYF61_005828 [Mycteria americana]